MISAHNDRLIATMLRKNTLFSLTTTVISIMLGMSSAVYAKLDADSFSTTVITGDFTDKTGLDGVVPAPHCGLQSKARSKY